MKTSLKNEYYKSYFWDHGTRTYKHRLVLKETGFGKRWAAAQNKPEAPAKETSRRVVRAGKVLTIRKARAS